MRPPGRDDGRRAQSERNAVGTESEHRLSMSRSSPRRIDFHFHLIPPFYQDAVYAAGAGPAIGRYPDWSAERALELMDANGIGVAVTSLAQPGVQFCDPAQAGAL